MALEAQRSAWNVADVLHSRDDSEVRQSLLTTPVSQSGDRRLGPFAGSRRSCNISYQLRFSASAIPTNQGSLHGLHEESVHVFH